MNWFTFSIVAYFLIALEVILDKFLISSERVSHPAIYAFYSGVMSIVAFLLFPFGFHLIPFGQAILSLIAGMIFVYGILSLFFAMKKSEASQVTMVVGATIPVIIYFLSIIFLREHLSGIELSGVVALIFGGIWISIDLNKKASRRLFVGFYFSILAGIFLAISYAWFKHFYHQDNFINVYIWTRFGVMLGALSLLLKGHWRRIIFKSLLNFKKPNSEHKSSGIIFVLNKALGGAGSILKEYATAIGSVTIVNALISVEYVFVFLLGIFFSFWFPSTFKEKMNTENVFQKISATIIIAIGLVLVFRFN